MFEIKRDLQGDQLPIPILVWLPDQSELEEGCFQQALNLSRFPFAHHHIALMPDTHQGFGMPIGGILATRDVIIPNAVGVDIGCGVAFAQTNLQWDGVSRQTVHKWVEAIMQKIPQGFSHHKDKMKAQALDDFRRDYPEEKQQGILWKEIERGYYQMGTLGGGNHFIELQSDEENRICLMIHSGSRNFGYQIARHFNTVAGRQRRQWQSCVPTAHQLDYLPEDSHEGRSYIRWMELAKAFARESRQQMLQTALQIVAGQRFEEKVIDIIDVHHNDVNQEVHGGTTVWVHRKGAIRANAGERGLIPGAMGRSSYVVTGRGNVSSFNSCSHGAGRAMSRKDALQNFSKERVMKELAVQQVVLGKKQLTDVGEEAPMAYKEIAFVMKQQEDLVIPVRQLKGKAVIKG
ncbi:RtcB family protein [Anoxynatronum buryatiense]|uniref:3'-phosphate/5'-hydroxy nucleic acid ligase n=1 Tax=Anoxynatronum buryatiense TaxID=489973 RepID=A0AA46AHP7_9CLOT|nr:RtcB family protein [Anoxynatronum buryatiense]SMP41400.1 tRNA-splicing ligase RtcB [Anoxynatronum buryatiense]